MQRCKINYPTVHTAVKTSQEPLFFFLLIFVLFRAVQKNQHGNMSQICRNTYFHDILHQFPAMYRDSYHIVRSLPIPIPNFHRMFTVCSGTQ